MISTLENLGGARVSALSQIETVCARYEGECSLLEEQIAALEADMETAKQKHLRGIKRQAGVVAGSEAELHKLIEGAPELFVQPRTLTLHGVKVGYTTSSGSVVWDDDDDEVVALIKRRFKSDEEWRQYVHVKETPNKNSLKKLSAADLAKLGCRLEDGGNVVVLKRVAGEVQKMIEKMTDKLVEAIACR